MKAIVLSLFLLEALLAEVYRVDIRPEGMRGDRVGSIRILDQKELLYAEAGGRHFSEISDLAYWPKKRWLFLISDEGELFRFRTRFGEKIRELVPMDASEIRKKSGKRLKKWQRDTEGLAVDGRGRLYVSFEGKPRIARITCDGRISRMIRLPGAIRSEKKLWRRNKGLEALVWHPRFGLVTAPEYPLRGASREIQTLYALSGETWRYRRGGEANSAITAAAIATSGPCLIVHFRSLRAQPNSAGPSPPPCIPAVSAACSVQRAGAIVVQGTCRRCRRPHISATDRMARTLHDSMATAASPAVRRCPEKVIQAGAIARNPKPSRLHDPVPQFPGNRRVGFSSPWIERGIGRLGESATSRAPVHFVARPE